MPPPTLSSSQSANCALHAAQRKLRRALLRAAYCSLRCSSGRYLAGHIAALALGSRARSAVTRTWQTYTYIHSLSYAYDTARQQRQQLFAKHTVLAVRRVRRLPLGTNDSAEQNRNNRISHPAIRSALLEQRKRRSSPKLHSIRTAASVTVRRLASGAPLAT